MRFVYLMLALCLATGRGYAQQAPSLGYVFPPVVEAGKTSDVAFGGYDFTPDMQFFVYDERVKLTPQGPPGEFYVPGPPYWFGPKGFSSAKKISREVPAKINIAADCPPGLVRWQVANANGPSTTAVLLVSDRPEIIEQRFRDQPQEIKSLPVGVSGRLSRITEVDRYQVQIAQDGPIPVELFARRLGSDFNGVIQVRDADGKILADQADTRGLDTAVTFAAAANKPYVVSIHDVDFRGHRSHVYRLAFTQGPRVIVTMPAAVQRGMKQEVKFLGIGVASGAARIESVTRELTIPKTAALKSMRYRLETPAGNAPAIEIPISDVPEFQNVTQMPVPGAVTTQFTNSIRIPHLFSAKKGQRLRFDAKSLTHQTGLDVAMEIIGEPGKVIAKNDDIPGSHDARLDFVVPADGKYRCDVREVTGRNADPRSVFRLSITEQQPGFRLSVPQQLKIAIGAKGQLAVKATRLAGFQDEIAIQVNGLPPGVTIPADLKLPTKKNDLKIDFTVAADAAALAAPITITGKSKIGDQEVQQFAMAPSTGNLCPRNPSDALIRQVLLTTTMKPPFTLKLVDKNRQRAVHRGTTYPAPFVIERDEGFQGEIQIMMSAAQSRHRQGIHGPIITVPSKAKTALYPCFMPEWLATDRTTRMVVLGAARVADPKGKLRYLTKPADARITMILEGALLKVSHQANELTVSPNSQFEIPLTISRSVKLPEAVSVALEIPEELNGALECTPVVVNNDQSRINLKIRALADTRLTGRWPLTIKATTMQDGRWLVMSQTKVEVEFDAATAN